MKKVAMWVGDEVYKNNPNTTLKNIFNKEKAFIEYHNYKDKPTE